jgi:hypothetical protein
MAITSFRDACLAVRNKCPNQYAKTYAQAALDYNMQGHEGYVQSLYILNNITHWRGDEACQVRTFLKAMPKE